VVIRILPHARTRMRERGATVAEVRQCVDGGQQAIAKFGRTRFRRVFRFDQTWNGARYAHKQIDAFAATIPGGWLMVTVIEKYF
jgi:hypothetical protein